jgi:hypothetical protein
MLQPAHAMHLSLASLITVSDDTSQTYLIPALRTGFDFGWPLLLQDAEDRAILDIANPPSLVLAEVQGAGQTRPPEAFYAGQSS